MDGILGDLGLGGHGALLLPDAAALGGELLGPLRILRPPCLAHLPGDGLHLCAQLVSPPNRGPRRHVELDQPIDLGGIDASTAEGRCHRRRVVPHQPDVDHDGDNGSVTWMSGSGGEAGDRPTDEPAVRCDELIVRYGSTVAVDRLSFTAGRGEVVAVLGPNGAGKTSTVECLEGYRPVSGGTASVLGLDPRRDHTALAARIGVMLQRGGVYPMLGATRLLRLFAGYYDCPADPDELLERVGLSRVARTPWRRLSGGEQQRLSLALALIGRPEVLFLDEPTAGVDPEGRLAVRDIVDEQRVGGSCVVLTTHELAEAERLADRVVIIDGGRKLAEGTPAGLSSSSEQGTVRFGAAAGLDMGALRAGIGGRRLGGRGRPRPLPHPAAGHRERTRGGGPPHRLAGGRGPRPLRPAHRAFVRGGLPGHHAGSARTGDRRRNRHRGRALGQEGPGGRAAGTAQAAALAPTMTTPTTP